MAKVKAFKAVRPTRDKVQLVASRPYMSYTKKALHSKLEENPFSFIHILQPEFPKVPGKANSEERFEAIRKRYTEFLKEETLVADKKNSFYIYRQVNGKHSYTGIIGCASTDDYHNNVIKKHELTLAKREETFKKYLDICNFNAEPVLMMYEENEAIENIIARYTHSRAEYDFTTTDRIRHSLWIISDTDHIASIENAFDKIDNLYIADGHHRSASSTLLAQERTKHNPNENANFRGLLSYFIPHTQLSIQPFHRMFKAKDIEESQNICAAIIKEFAHPEGDIKMCFDGKIHSLKVDNEGDTIVSSLASSRVSNKILQNICGVKDERNDKRITHIGGEIALNVFCEQVSKSNNTIGFYLEAVKTEELFKIADNGEYMPPKSTYIEPKMRSGMTILEL
jgi:uncharacterized protein (DUF1015 family)